MRRLRRIYQDLCRGALLTASDRAFLIEQAKRDLPDDKILLLLRVFGLLRDAGAASLIEGFLQRTDVPALAYEALRALWRSGLQGTISCTP